MHYRNEKGKGKTLKYILRPALKHITQYCIIIGDIFFEKKAGKIWWSQKLCLPLHTDLETTLFTLKKQNNNDKEKGNYK